MSTLLVSLAHFLGAVFVFAGAFFFIAATVGVVRMPDPIRPGTCGREGRSSGVFALFVGYLDLLVDYQPC
jgi:multisubunit Na+/H+ antiporter MnhG subunit